MARRTSQTITDHVTCDICGKEWDEDVTRRKIDDDKDDMCPECTEAYNAWKFQRKKEANKLALD